MLKKVLEWPNKKLRQPSETVYKIDEDVKQLVVNMIDTCKVMFGAGLAAPQIGVHKRVVILKPADFNYENTDPAEYDSDYTVFINPVLELSDQKVEWVEACLSLPGTDGKVERSENVKLSYMNLNGETKIVDIGWPFAGAVQHEVDHLDGTLFHQRQKGRRGAFTLDKLRRKRRKQMIRDRKARRASRGT